MSELEPKRHDRGDPRPDRPTRVETVPGVFPDVDAAARDAALRSLAECDAPIRRADELVGAVAGDALKAVVAMRVEQIVKHGHTVEDDMMLPLLWLPRQIKQHAEVACARIGVTGTDRNLVAAKRHLAITAALCLAAIDRITVAIERKEEG